MTVEQDTYFIARSEDNSVIHACGLTKAGSDFSSGQPIVEQFATKEEYENRLINLGINIE